MRNKILAAIIAELNRQRDENRFPFDLGWLDADNPQQSKVDGTVDLVALAESVEKVIISQPSEER